MAYGIEIVLRGGERVLGAIRRVRDGLLEAGRASDRVGGRTGLVDGRVVPGGRVGRDAALPLHRRLGNFARAAGRFGFGGQLGEALGAPTAGLAALGAAGVAAAMAVRALSTVAEHQRRVLDRRIQQERELTELVRSNRTSAGRAALATGTATASAMRQLIGAGGNHEALGRRAGARFGAAGLEAAATMSSGGVLDERSLAALRLAVETGMISPEQFASVLSDNRGLGRAAGNDADLARAVVSKHLGRDPGDLGPRSARVAMSDYGKLLSEVDRRQGEQFGVNMGNFAAGRGLSELVMDTAALRNPDAAAQTEAFRRWDEQLQVLRRIDQHTRNSALLLLRSKLTGNDAENDYLAAQRTGPGEPGR